MKVICVSRWLVFFVFVFTGTGLFAAEPVHLEPAWDIMNRARISFDQGDPGNALALCENARSMHKELIAGYVQQLDTAITSAVMTKSGGEILSVRKILLERNETAAVSIIDLVLGIHDEKYFKNSISGLVQWLDKRSAYPEADLLSGDVYASEGEYVLAREFYLKAWQLRDFLKIPEERFDICYRLADIARIAGNFGEQEEYLLMVLTEDPVYGKPGAESASLIAMKRTLETTDDGEKFFSLYRHRNRFALKAYQDLTEFYFFRSGKRTAHAFSTATLAAVLSITILDDFLAMKLVDYEFSSFSDVMSKSERYPDILEEAERLRLWDSFIDLALIMADSGISAPAVSILQDLSVSCPDPSISLKAQGLLKKIF